RAGRQRRQRFPGAPSVRAFEDGPSGSGSTELRHQGIYIGGTIDHQAVGEGAGRTRGKTKIERVPAFPSVGAFQDEALGRAGIGNEERRYNNIEVRWSRGIDRQRADESARGSPRVERGPACSAIRALEN